MTTHHASFDVTPYLGGDFYGTGQHAAIADIKHSLLEWETLSFIGMSDSRVTPKRSNVQPSNLPTEAAQ